jgi:hypothetical protein
MKTKHLLLFLFLIIETAMLHAQTIIPTTLAGSTVLTVAQSPYLVPATTTLLAGAVLTVQPGVEIKMSDSSAFIIKGKAEFLGSAAQPIYIHPENLSWRNIFLDNASGHCIFNYVTIESATSTPHHINLTIAADTALQRAAFSTYYSSVELNNCTFKNNLQCIYSKYGSVAVKTSMFDSTNVKEKINIQFVRNALIEDCVFHRTIGTYDMIDFDGINNGVIRNNTMYEGEDDAIDLGEWESKPCDTVLVEKNFIYKMLFGKGISVGEKSKNVTLERNVIVACGIGIAVKDDSYAFISNNTLWADSLGISCYEKTVGWGGATANIRNTIIADSYIQPVKTDALSTANVSYSISNTIALTGATNLFGDPYFIAIPADFRLQPISPCINTGDPASPLDPDLSIADIGAHYFDTAAVSISECSGTNAIRVYPNPTAGMLEINYHCNAKSCIIYIENAKGQRVYSKNLSTSSGVYNEMIDLKTQAKGMYFIHLITDKKSISKKIILN